MRNKLLLFSVSLFTALLFSSCGKDMGALDPSYFKTTPNPLEVKGGLVSATVTGQFPVKYFNKNAVVTVTPVLKYDGTEVKGTPSVFQGEKVKGNDKQIVYKAGGTYTMNVNFRYVPEMAVSELYLEFDVVQKSKTYTIPSVKVADGVIATSQLVSTSGKETTPAIIPDKFQRVIQEQEEADILFLIQRADLRKTETSSSDVVALTKKIQDVQGVTNQEVSNFEVAGYASPDGPIDLNTNLAERRQKVTVDYLNKELNRLKSSVKIDSKFTAEDWDGFQKLMENSNIQDKQLILRVLTMYTDPEQREREIKNISAAYKTIADDILPQLRRSRLKLTVDIIGKSDAEITAAAQNNPTSLTVEELLYAATLTDNLAQKAAIYQAVVQYYPNDARGHNNLGAIQYYYNTEEADRLFTRAAQLSPSSPDVNFNLGLTSLSKGEIVKAEEYFGKAAGTSGNLNKALGSLYIVQGDYAKAKTSFGSEVSNNAALLQILNNDYNSARRTLASVTDPDATTSYLSAVIAARTNDRDAVYSNLRKAAQLDKEVAKKALTDLEFSKFFTDSTFISIFN